MPGQSNLYRLTWCDALWNRELDAFDCLRRSFEQRKLADIEDCIAVAEMEGQDGEDTPALRALAARLATTLHD